MGFSVSSATSGFCFSTSSEEDGISKGSLPEGLLSPKIVSSITLSCTPKVPIRPKLFSFAVVSIAGLFKSEIIINFDAFEYLTKLVQRFHTPKMM